jgi:stage III sporulation protein SpoIIIAA
LSSMPQTRTADTFERKDYELEITDNLEDLLSVLPPHIADALAVVDPRQASGGLIEIVMDLGRRPEARFQEGEVELAEREVTREDLFYVADRIGRFGEDNRAGIERTLHRISAMRNRGGDIVGLTCRIGRAVYGTIAIIRDLIESGESILLLGRPGVGKTTMLRETARVVADELRKRVVIVDTSNEIAGDGDIPHPGIGRARRMQVPAPTAQHAVMIEAVENHMPQVVVIDEIGTELEAVAARTIAERGVQLVGTAHGNSLENLMMNPTLSDLIGGIQSVTLSDEEARRRGTQKSILERKAPPTFGIMIEIISRDEVAVHTDVASTVDAILRGVAPRTELRRREDDGQVEIGEVGPRRELNGVLAPQRGMERREIVDITSRQPARDNSPEGQSAGAIAEAGGDFALLMPRGRGTEARPLRVYPFGVSRNRLEQAIAQLNVPAMVVRDQREADLVVTLKNYYRRKPQPLRDAEAHGTPVYVLRANTGTQMEQLLGGLFSPSGLVAGVVHSREPAAAPRDIAPAGPAPAKAQRSDGDPVAQAMVEAEDAISTVMEGGPPISLTPQSSYVRRLQHQLADRYNVASRSRGREPQRRVEVYREGGVR